MRKQAERRDPTRGDAFFANVDLDVFSKVSLQPLVAALNDDVSIHYVGREGGQYGAHFALNSPANMEVAVRGLVKLVEGLPRPARRLWNGAKERIFNIGIQGGTHPHASIYRLSEESTAAIKRVKGSIVITIYAPDQALTASPK